MAPYQVGVILQPIVLKPDSHLELFKKWFWAMDVSLCWPEVNV